MELGLQDVLNRVERIGQSVEDNVNRVSDNVQGIERKLDALVEGHARLEGTLETHISSEDTWRREVSERINLVDVEAKHRVKEAKEEALKVAIEAKVLAELASKSKNDWGVRWQTVVALLGLIGVIIGVMVGVQKMTESPTRGNSHISSPASPPPASPSRP